jgi:hypothetical protein
MKRMNVVMLSDNSDDGGSDRGSSGSGCRFECNHCHMDFPNKTTVDRHMLFCKTLADIRRGGGVSSATHQTLAAGAAEADPLLPTPREMFILIQELAAKYNKVKDELDVMKQWAKMVGRRMNSAGGGGGGGSGIGSGAEGAGAGLDFTSITRQKRQNKEVILNEEDAEHPDLAELRPAFTEWIAEPSLSAAISEADLKVVFNEDLIAGITAAILRVLSEYTAETGKSHLSPFKLADIKQGAFYIYDTAFGVAAAPPPEIGLDPPTRRWRAMEPCEFQLLVRTFHKFLFKEFKKWQDENWDAQKQMTQQRQNSASSFQHVMSSFQYQCSPAMATCDGMYDTPVSEPILSEDFATLYNKYADKMMGGALSDDTILSRVRAKLWKDMKAWRF